MTPVGRSEAVIMLLAGLKKVERNAPFLPCKCAFRAIFQFFALAAVAAAAVSASCTCESNAKTCQDLLLT